ncbi:hypothetical protein EB001_26670 [bacterium]|nr:hypothetical protein [bacterium]
MSDEVIISAAELLKIYEYAVKEANARIAELEKFKKLVEFIANDYHELSYEKAQWQRDDWKKRCKKLIEEYDEINNSSRIS